MYFVLILFTYIGYLIRSVLQAAYKKTAIYHFIRKRISSLRREETTFCFQGRLLLENELFMVTHYK